MCNARRRGWAVMRAVLLAAISINAAAPVVAAPEPKSGTPASQARPTDLADTAQGLYHGDVISDARGSSQSDVQITVIKVGRNKVSVTSDYSRLPTFTASLTRAMNTIQATGTQVVFLLDLSKQPPSLDINVDDASWSGSKH